MLRHGSTFANNALGCAAAMATLDRLTDNGHALIKAVAERGTWVKETLNSIRDRYPKILREVRGQGYFIGLEFSTDPIDYEGSISSLLCRSEPFGFILSSYLLEHHRLRVAPTFNQMAVLRIEPALDITPALFSSLFEGIDALAHALDRGDSATVMGHALGLAPGTRRHVTERVKRQTTTPVSSRRFAFLIHMMDLSDISRFDPSLSGLQPEAFAEARRILPDLLEPAVLTRFEVVTPDGRSAVGDLIVVPYTADELMEMPLSQSSQIIGDAAVLAETRGAEIVGLGGFTSVVTAGGRSIVKRVSIPVTTGNAFTAVSGVKAIYSGLAGTKAPASATAMIFGAFGSVGGAMTKLLAQQIGQLRLIVKKTDQNDLMSRTNALRSSLKSDLARMAGRLAPGSIGEAVLSGADTSARLVVSDDPDPYWRNSDVVVTATTALGEIIAAADLPAGAVVCDISRPVNISRGITAVRPDVIFIEGGVIRPYGLFDSGNRLGSGPRSDLCLHGRNDAARARGRRKSQNVWQ